MNMGIGKIQIAKILHTIGLWGASPGFLIAAFTSVSPLKRPWPYIRIFTIFLFSSTQNSFGNKAMTL